MKERDWPTLARDREILDVARKMIEGVPYKVTMRWVFYRLYQAGYYHGKGESGDWNRLTRGARERRYEDWWYPGTFIDATRAPILRAGGYQSEKEHLEAYAKGLRLPIVIDHFFKQKAYVECWFEAKAMIGQFERYTKGINLVPFGGGASYSLLWDCGETLNKAYEKYDKQCVVLYFGDLDKWGINLYKAALEHVEDWSAHPDLEFHRCGLNQDQVDEYGIPENPDKPGQYQWEALSDEQAQEIIEEGLNEYLDLEEIERAERLSQERSGYWGKKLTKVLKGMIRREDKP